MVGSSLRKAETDGRMGILSRFQSDNIIRLQEKGRLKEDYWVAGIMMTFSSLSQHPGFKAERRPSVCGQSPKERPTRNVDSISIAA